MNDRLAVSSALPVHRPYLSSGTVFQIGTRPMDPAQWLAIGPDHGSFLREKRARLQANPLPFYRTTPGSLPAQLELRDRVVAHLLAHQTDVFSMADGRLVDCVEGTAHELDGRGVEPLALISQFLEEDFILLQQVDGQDQITAASNAYSSSGRIVSSVGRSIPWAHKFVPTLNDQLGPRIDRVLGNIKVDAPVERFNWLLTPIASRLFPEDPHAANTAAVDNINTALVEDPSRAGEILWIRVERQTLLRLPESGALAFSIYTYSDPLSSIAGDHESLAAMHRLIGSYSEDRMNYAAMASIRAPVLKWLESQLN
jgi:hypothetical protein